MLMYVYTYVHVGVDVHYVSVCVHMCTYRCTLCEYTNIHVGVDVDKYSYLAGSDGSINGVLIK